MEHNRKQKLLMIIALVFGIASLSIGFAAFSTTLSISSSASVSPNSDTFSVKFSTSQNSLVVGAVAPSSNPYGLTTTNGIIDNSLNPTITNLSATFTQPGQVVVYTFYARNEGEYTAYLNRVNFIGEKSCTGGTDATAGLIQNACDDINVYAIIDNVFYNETTQVTGHALGKNTGEEIMVVLEYKGSDYVDGAVSISFPSLSLIYSTIDNPTAIVPSVQKKLSIDSGDLNTVGSVVSIGDEKFYVIGQEDENLKLLSMYNLHVGSNVYPGDNYSFSVVPIENPTGIQDSTALGSVWKDMVQVFPFVAVTAFSHTSESYTGSIVEGYVDNYISYLKTSGVDITEGRLMRVDEMEAFECTYYTTCSSVPEWLHNTSFWLMDGQSAFGNNQGFHMTYFLDDYNYGVRPVIEIPLSEF